MKTPFRPNDYVKYGVNGVCLISDIQIVKAPDGSTESEYYVLKPISLPSSTIYVPVGNEVLVAKMRRLLSQEEIDQIIAAAENEDFEWVEDRKERGLKFHDILSRCDQQELLRLAKCIHSQKVKLIASGKKLSAGDETVMKQAEEFVANELAFVLDIPNSQVGDYIREILKINEADEADMLASV